MRKLVLLALLIAALTPATAGAAVFVVDDDVGASGDCTSDATACKTIGEAITKARAVTGPNEIDVRAGTYVESLALTQAADQNLTIMGAGPAQTTIRHNNGVLGATVILGAGTATENLTLRDLTVEVPSTTTAADKIGVLIQDSGAEVRNVAVKMQRASGTGGGIFVSGNDALIRDVTLSGTWSGDGVVVNNDYTGVEIRDSNLSGSSVVLHTSGGSVVDVNRTRFERTTTFGPVVQYDDTGTGTIDSSLILGGQLGFYLNNATSESATALLRNATIDTKSRGIDDSASGARGVHALAGSAGPSTITLRSSITVEKQDSERQGAGSPTVTCTASDVPLQVQAQTVSVGAINCGAGGFNSHAAPGALFESAGTGDYHLATLSPALDAGLGGAIAAGESSADLDVLPRLVDGDCDGVLERDQGAFEVQVASCPNSDADAVPDGGDNCDFLANPDQANLDGDAQGDACDADDDGDGRSDVTDNCPVNFNPGQADTDADGKGDACDKPVSKAPCGNVRLGNAANNVLVGTALGDRILGFEGKDRLTGKAGRDCLEGGGGPDFLDGGDGGDQLDGGRDRDTMKGGRGGDFLDSVDGKRDVVDCGAGPDRAEVDEKDVLKGCERVTRV